MVELTVIYALYVVLILVGAAIHLAVSRQPRTQARVAEVFLLWCLVIGSGLAGLVGFYSHTARADTTAASIGWPAGNPFQAEVAAANLGLGLLGVLCIWLRGHFWTATVVMTAAFMLGAAYVHVEQIVRYGNYAPGNAGPPLYLDILLPLADIALLAAYWRQGRYSR